ncbi:MAG: hypothetical protein R3A10_10930 [Caldilineaceae bacterium]
MIAKVEILGKDGTTPEYFRTGDMLRLRGALQDAQPIDTPTLGWPFTADGAHVNGPNPSTRATALPDRRRRRDGVHHRRCRSTRATLN